MTDQIFVYGTLRPAFRPLPEGVTHVCSAIVRGRLYLAKPGSYPVLVPDSDGGLVVGDILEYDSESSWWETVEHVETGAGYVLGEVKVGEGPGGPTAPTVRTWCWMGPVDELLRIKSGDWLEAFVGFGDSGKSNAV